MCPFKNYSGEKTISNTNKSRTLYGAKLIALGDKGHHIKKLQIKLAELGHYNQPVGSVFDEEMETAVRSFQIDRGIDADGKIGKETQLKLLGRCIPPAVRKLDHPESESENFEVFGDFRMVGWWKANLAHCDLLFLFDCFKHVAGFHQERLFGFECHRLVVPHFQRAFSLVAKAGLHGRIVEYDGCFKVRYKRTRHGYGGDSDWSSHCWGIAIDLNSSSSPLGAPLGSQKLQIDEGMAKCFEKSGFFWGGRSKDIIDTMHFQFCSPERC